MHHNVHTFSSHFIPSAFFSLSTVRVFNLLPVCIWPKSHPFAAKIKGQIWALIFLPAEREREHIGASEVRQFELTLSEVLWVKCQSLMKLNIRPWRRKCVSVLEMQPHIFLIRTSTQKVILVCHLGEQGVRRDVWGARSEETLDIRCGLDAVADRTKTD